MPVFEIFQSLYYVNLLVNRRKELGGGTVLNIGVYTIQMCQWIFKQAPRSINATGSLNDDGVDLMMTAQIKYNNNKMCKIRTSALTTFENAATIIGSKGQIKVNLFLKK